MEPQDTPPECDNGCTDPVTYDYDDRYGQRVFIAHLCTACATNGTAYTNLRPTGSRITVLPEQRAYSTLPRGRGARSIHKFAHIVNKGHSNS